MKKLLLVSVLLLSLIFLVGCGVITPPCTVGSLDLNILDNWQYWVDIDGWEWGTTNWSGDIVINNIPIGWHTIYVLSTDWFYDGTTNIYINCGMNYLSMNTF